MTGADADTEQKVGADEPDSADPASLAKFLTPVIPRPKSGAPDADAVAQEIAPPEALAPQRTSIFDALLVPRRNSSLLPPPGDADATEETSDIGTFEEHESPTSNLAVEKSLQDDDLDADEDFLPRRRTPIDPTLIRRAAIAVGGLVVALCIVLIFRRASRRPESVTTAGPLVEAPALAATRDEAAEPLDDPDFVVPIPDVEKGRELRREARRHLEAGRAEEGVSVARQAIEADANDPEGYILLAAGLQDLGRWKESRDVFVKCVRESNGKMNTECVYFATRSK
jgi:hypothetical protein